MSSPNQVVVSQVNDVTIVEITTAGPQGETGPQGPQGIGSATVSIGTTSTGNAGTDASVTNTGTGTEAVLNFTIPRGNTGATGPTGPQGNTGATGPAGADGNDGADGATGATGAAGSAATIAIGTVTTGAAGSSATVTNSGSSSAATFDFSIPRGATGADGNDGSDATVNATNVNNAGAVMNSDLDGKGELLVGDGSGDPSALPVGTNGYILKANDSTATGLEWAAAGAGGDVNQNAFSTIAVSGQSDVVADSVTDTLNIAAGSNVTITTNAGSDTVTIASTDTNTTYTAGTGLSLSGTTFNVDQIALTTVQVAANESAQLALTTQEGDIVVRSDQNKSYVRNSGSAGTMADFTELLTPTDQVLSVNGNTGAITAAQIAAAVEAASDSNTFTDADHTKLNGIDAGAKDDQTASEIKTLLQSDKLTVDEIADDAITADKLANSINTEIATNTAKVSNANHTGDVTGSTALTIADDAVTYAKMQNVSATDRVLGRDSSGAGVVEEITPANLRTMINVEDGADVTDATNVASAGAVMDGDFTSNGFMKRTGAGNYTVDTNTYLTSVPSGYLQNVSEDSSPQLGANLDVQTNEITTSTSNGNIKLNPNGTGVVEVMGDGTSSGTVGTLQLNCSNNNHGVKIASPPHSAGASYTLTLPNTDGDVDQVLKTDGSGNLDWVDQSGGGGGLSSDAQFNTVGGTNAGDSFSGTSAEKNTLIGYNAGTAITTGDQHTYIGYDAGASYVNATDVGGSTAVGFEALKTATSTDNTAVGDNALKSLTSGYYNVAIGSWSQRESTTSQRNTTLGAFSGRNITSGQDNICVGYQTGQSITTGSSNLCLGSQAGIGSGTALTTGSNNIIIGNTANASSATVSNEITLGDSNITSLRCQVQTISSLSDARDKTDIVDSPDGLKLINLLRPRKFTWAMRQASENDGKTELGFIAQELDEALGDKNDYIHAVSKNNPDKLEVSYGRLIPVLVKAIQELTIEVETLKANG